MTEPDEALLWAREDLAKKFEPFKPYISETIRNGAWDNDAAMRASVIGYRAGAAASAERIKALEARVAELEKLTDDGSLSYAGYRYGVVTKLSDHERRIEALERLTEATTIRRPYGD